MTLGYRTTIWRLRASVLAAAVFSSVAAQAQVPLAIATPAPAVAPLNLRQVFEAAWARQPEAMALQARRDAARAQQNAAQAHGGSAAHQRNQHENEFASVHVAKESHAV